MKCPKCYEEIGEPKKYEIINCQCGRKLMIIEINKTKSIEDVTPDKED